MPALATGVLLAFSYPPYPLPFVSFIALIPLINLWERLSNPREIFLFAYLAFQLTFVLTFSWPLFHAYRNTAFASLTGVILIPLTMALPFSLSGIIKKKQPRWVGFASLYSLYLLQEAFWIYGPIKMPSALLGHSVSEWLIVKQLAAIGGVGLLSVLILSINHLLYTAWNESTYRYRRLAYLSILIISTVVYGFQSIERFETQSPTDTIRTMVIQPAVNSEAWTVQDDSERVERMLSTTDSALARTEGIQMVFWPETAIPLAPTEEGDVIVRARLKSWAESRGVALVSGAISRSRLPVDPAVAFTNSAYYFAQEIKRYDKNVLMPFAERVPFESLVPGFDRLRVSSGGVAGYQAGEDQPVFSLGPHGFGLLICFESVFGRLARTYSEAGASFIVVLSNIGWWGPRLAPSQYLAFSSLRSVENRIPVVISTVSGPSALIHPTGRIERLGTWMQHGAFEISIPLHTQKTVYGRLGDWPFALAALMLFVTLVLFVRNAF